MKETRKVIILRHIDSPVISQAIFILKDSCCEEFSALSEAERIVSEYVTKKEKKEKNRSFFLVTGILMTVVAVFLCLYFKF